MHFCKKNNIFVVEPADEGLYFFLSYNNNIVKDDSILEENHHQLDQYDNIKNKHLDDIHRDPQTNDSIKMNVNFRENKQHQENIFLISEKKEDTVDLTHVEILDYNKLAIL